MSHSSSSSIWIALTNALPTTIAELSSYCTYFMIFMGICMLIACTFKTAVYGRYSTSQGWGPLIKAKIAWIVMESPNLWISVIVFLLARSHRKSQAQNPANILLLLFFFAHYIHRDLIFPFKMAACEPTDMPVSVMLLAFVFCCFNGSTQALALMYGSTYRYVHTSTLFIYLTLFLIELEVIRLHLLVCMYVWMDVCMYVCAALGGSWVHSSSWAARCSWRACASTSPATTACWRCGWRACARARGR